MKTGKDSNNTAVIPHTINKPNITFSYGNILRSESHKTTIYHHHHQFSFNAQTNHNSQNSDSTWL